MNLVAIDPSGNYCSAGWSTGGKEPDEEWARGSRKNI